MTKRSSEDVRDSGTEAAVGRRTFTAQRAGRMGWRTARLRQSDGGQALAEVTERLAAREFGAALGLLHRLKAGAPRSFWRGGRWRLWQLAGQGLREAGGDPAGAAEAFGVLHDLRPHHLPTLLRLGEALAAAGDYGRAFHAYYAALELVPDDPQAHFLLGVLYGERQDLTRARRCLERAVSLSPRDGQFWAALGYALQAEGESRRALSCYEKAASLEPKDAAVWNALGLLYAQGGEAAKGVVALRRGLRLSPGDPGILLNLSTVYGRDLEDFGRALRYALRLLDLEPENAGAHHNLGLIYWALGEVDEAQVHLHRALELGSDAPEIWASYNAFRKFLGKN
jgi:tetratricopeptide (TPR) repeat protein